MNLRRTLSWFFTRTRPVLPSIRQLVRPRLECLEDRFVPSEFLWVGSGTWSSSSNWINLSVQGHPHGVPGSSDTALFEPDDTGDGGSDGDCSAGAVTVAAVQMDSSYDGTFSAEHGFTVSGLFFQYGTLDVGNGVSVGTMSINGKAELTGGSLTCTNFNLYATGEVTNSTDSTIDSQTYDDVGKITVTGGILTIDNSFTASAGSDTSVSGGGELSFPTGSTVTISGGTLSLSGGGATASLGSSGATFDMAGTLDSDIGTNTIRATYVEQDGTIDLTDNPGFTHLDIDGSLSQTTNASTSMNISDTGNDAIVVTGSASLGGTLDVAGAPTGTGYLTWNLVTGTTVSGGFSSVDLPDPPTGYEWQYGASGSTYQIALVAVP